LFHNYYFSRFVALGIGAVSLDLEKQGFLAVVFVNREYSRQPPDSYRDWERPN
jgi:hypothetical protein